MVPLEVGGKTANATRRLMVSTHDALFARDQRRSIDFEHGHLLQFSHPERATIESCAQDNDLLHGRGECFSDPIVDEARSCGTGAAGAGCPPIEKALQ